jgi:iron-sulfur cluster assembly accessory protein
MLSTYDAKWLNKSMDTKMQEEIVSFTPTAQEHFAAVVKGANALGVRLTLAGGGCAGFSYHWELVKSPSEIDMTEYGHGYDGWMFWLDKTSELYLTGSVVDKKTDISGSVIDIWSPLAASSCGCGESVNFKV